MSVTHSDRLWVGDINQNRSGKRFIYLAVILDVYTQAVQGWAFSRTIDKQLTPRCLRMVFSAGHLAISHADHGVQYAAWKHTEMFFTVFGQNQHV